MDKIILFRDTIWKGKIAPIILFIWVCGILFAFALKLFLPPGTTPETPQVVFKYAGPCLDPGKELVENFEVGDTQYICAEMESDTSPVHLYLYVFKDEQVKPVFIGNEEYESGYITFRIYPPLSPGKYWAKITLGRPNLVNFEFDVVEKNDK